MTELGTRGKRVVTLHRSTVFSDNPFADPNNAPSLAR